MPAILLFFAFIALMDDGTNDRSWNGCCLAFIITMLLIFVGMIALLVHLFR